MFYGREILEEEYILGTCKNSKLWKIFLPNRSRITCEPTVY